MDQISILDSHLTDKFQKALLSASVLSLMDKANPLAFNNFCGGFRELVRHVMSGLAPEKEVVACSWFTPDPNAKGGITRGHRVAYIIHGGLDAEYVQDELGVDVQAERRALTKAVDELSKYVHVNPDTFGIEHEEAVKNAVKAVEALTRILQAAKEFRDELSRSLERHIEERVVFEAISETIMSIDELATHHSVDEIYVGNIEVIGVNSSSIFIRVSGSIGVELQWGSNGDRRRGDGAELGASFPFVCELESSVESPDEVDVIESSLNVDTSSWWEGYYDET